MFGEETRSEDQETSSSDEKTDLSDEGVEADLRMNETSPMSEAGLINETSANSMDGGSDKSRIG